MHWAGTVAVSLSSSLPVCIAPSHADGIDG